MADSIHNALSKFRDNMLTAVAVLEFELRDVAGAKDSKALESLTTAVGDLEKRIYNIEKENNDILNISPPVNNGNVVVAKCNSPALAAAIASLRPSTINLSDDEYEEVDADDEADDDEDDEDEIEVEDFEYKGTFYQRDSEGTVYLDGEEVGRWNGKKIIAS